MCIRDSVCGKAHAQYYLNDHIVHHRAYHRGKQLECEIVEHTAEDDLADDDGGKPDDDGATAHVDVGKALILRKQDVYKRQAMHMSQHEQPTACAP